MDTQTVLACTVPAGVVNMHMRGVNNETQGSLGAGPLHHLYLHTHGA